MGVMHRAHPYQIKLTQGQYATIDLGDFELINRFNWHFTHGYAASKENGKRIYMHRIVLGAEPSQEVDHINRDKLDNRKSNLRFVTRTQNCFNKDPQSNNTSGYSGISWAKSRECWRAYIKIKGRQVWLGYHKTLPEAINARKEAEELWV